MQVTHARAPLLRTLSAFAARDGILSLWDGLSASILRQATYSTARFGLYNYFARQFQSLSAGGGPLSASATVATAGLAGGLAGVIGNPTEVSWYPLY
jgi:dicarboxylate transporter 10